MPATDLLTLHAFMVFEGKKGFVAHCLETGSVGIGASEEIAQSNLCGELEKKINSGDVKNLFKSKAPAAIWAKWCETHRAVTGPTVTNGAYQKKVRLCIKSEDAPVAEKLHLVRADD